MREKRNESSHTKKNDLPKTFTISSLIKKHKNQHNIAFFSLLNIKNPKGNVLICDRSAGKFFPRKKIFLHISLDFL